METIKRMFLNIGIVITATVASVLWWSYFAWSTASWFVDDPQRVAAIQLDATLAALMITPVATVLALLLQARREAKAKRQQP